MIGPMDEIGSERAPMGNAMVVHGLIESTVGWLLVGWKPVGWHMLAAQCCPVRRERLLEPFLLQVLLLFQLLQCLLLLVAVMTV